jgi:transcriptional regulator with XRE-family HTH domain
MTQPELAKASGIQQAEISRIETGRANPTIDTVTRLTRALGTHLTLA